MGWASCPPFPHAIEKFKKLFLTLSSVFDQQVQGDFVGAEVVLQTASSDDEIIHDLVPVITNRLGDSKSSSDD